MANIGGPSSCLKSPDGSAAIVRNNEFYALHSGDCVRYSFRQIQTFENAVLLESQIYAMRPFVTLPDDESKSVSYWPCVSA